MSSATVFRSRPRLVLLGTATGTVTASLATGSDPDDVFFDRKRRRIHLSCGEGVVDAVQQEAGGVRLLTRTETSSGPRASLFVPELDQLFVAARAGLLGSDAALLVFRAEPRQAASWTSAWGPQAC